MMTYFEQMRRIGPHPVWQVTPSATTHLQQMQALRASELANQPSGTATPQGGYPLTFHSPSLTTPGAVIPNPKLFLVYLGNFWGDRTKLESFASDVMVEGYLAPLKDYGSGPGTYIGSLLGPTPATSTITDAQIQKTLQDLLASDLPKPDGNTLYSFVLPNGITVQMDAQSASCAQFCGYHSAINTTTFYSVHPATNCQGCNLGDAFKGMTMCLGHEIAEACTDAVPGTGWFVSAPGQPQDGMENADEFAWIEETYGPWTVQGFQVNGVGNDYGAYQLPPPTQPAPVVTITTIRNVSNQSEASFSASIENAARPVIEWDFGDGVKAANAQATVDHTYATAGTFTVTCTVADSASGRIGSATVQLAISTTPKPAEWPGKAWCVWGEKALEWAETMTSSQEITFVGQELNTAGASLMQMPVSNMSLSIQDQPAGSPTPPPHEPETHVTAVIGQSVLLKSASLKLAWRGWVDRLSSRKFQAMLTADLAIGAAIVQHYVPGEPGVIVAGAVTGIWLFVEGMADILERYQTQTPQ